MTDTSPTALPSRRQMREQAAASTGSTPTQTVSRRERRMMEQSIPESAGGLPATYPADPNPPLSSYSTAPVLSPPLVQGAVAGVTQAPTEVGSPMPPSVPAAPLSRRQLREQQTAAADVALGSLTSSPPPPVNPLMPDSGGAVAPAPVMAPPPLPPVFSDPAQSLTTEAPTAPSRSVGVSAPATNALILPTAPSLDLAGPIGDTGEILVTGNIPLPRLVSEKAMTGLVDADTEDDYVSVDTGAFTAPVRATQAVSTRSMEIEQPMIKRPSWGMSSMVLGFSAAILGVTALALLALALLTDIISRPF